MNRTAGLPEMQSDYVNVGDLRMYCETLGEGPPLLLLHAGMATIGTSFPNLRPMLAKRWTTVSVEQQAHGHTADIARSLSYEQMVEDTAAMLRKKKISGADVFGWSDGGIVALGLAARYPELVHKVAIIGAGYNTDAEVPDFKQRMAALKPDNEHIEPFRNEYRRIAPHPEQWPALIEKVKFMYSAFKGWSEAEMRSFPAPLMVMMGDQDFLRPEHALELFRMAPNRRLAVLPGSDHSAPVLRADWVAAMLVDFFGAPDKELVATHHAKDKR